MSKVFVMGYGHHIGGASGEMLGALATWRTGGLMPTLIPTWGPGHPDYRKMMDEMGYKTINVPEQIKGGIKNIPDFPGSTVIAFCNAHAVAEDCYRTMKEIGIRFVWVPTMCHPVKDQNGWCPEAIAFAKHGLPDVFVYQSAFQRHSYESLLIGELVARGVPDPYAAVTSRGRLIRGAFDTKGWTYAPKSHALGKPFVLGKLGRPDPNKWHPDLWRVYEKVPYSHRAALVMGLNPDIVKGMPPLPEWATWLKPMGMSVQTYYSKIDCLVPLNAPGVVENFPRIGLECFALGIPVVARREGGWCEMIQDGVTGLLGDSDDEISWLAGELIYRPKRRLEIVHNAREWLVKTVSPEVVWPEWRSIFGLGESLAA